MVWYELSQGMKRKEWLGFAPKKGIRKPVSQKEKKEIIRKRNIKREKRGQERESIECLMKQG